MPSLIAGILIPVILQVGAIQGLAATPEAQPNSDSEAGEPPANAPEYGFGGPEANAYGSNEALDWTGALFKGLPQRNPSQMLFATHPNSQWKSEKPALRSD